MELPYAPRPGSKARRLVSSLERVKQRSSPSNEKIRVPRLSLSKTGGQHGTDQMYANPQLAEFPDVPVDLRRWFGITRWQSKWDH